MSETPRTEAAVFKILSSLQSGTDDVVHADFARELEMELAAAKAHHERRKNETMVELMNANARVADLESRLAAAEKDARRYRWLRDKYDNQQHRVLTLPSTMWDAATDAALAQEPKG